MGAGLTHRTLPVLVATRSSPSSNRVPDGLPGRRSAAEFLGLCYLVLIPNIRSTTKLFSMGTVGYIVSLVILGFAVGGLGRLVVPGPNPIGLWRTLGLGLIGVFTGSLIGGLLGIGIFTIIFEVVISAGLVYLVSGRSRRLTMGGRR